MIWYRRCATVFGLTRFRIDGLCLVLEASRKWRHCTPSVTCVEWLLWWYEHAPFWFPPSLALALGTKMSDERKFTSLSGMHVKKWRKKISIEIRRNTANWKGWTKCCRMPQWFAHSSICTIGDNADRITESAKSGTKVATLPQSYRNKLYQKLWIWVSCIFVAIQINKRHARLRVWLRHCATSRKVAGSISDGVTGIFHWHNPAGRTMALGLPQPLTEMRIRIISWEVRAAGA
jgi:hypothetical protein